MAQTGNAWADSFTATANALRNAERDRELESVVDDQPGLATVAPAAQAAAPDQYQALNAAQSNMPALAASAPVQAAPQVTAAQRRASIYRSYGQDKEADDLLQNAVNLKGFQIKNDSAGLELANAQRASDQKLQRQQIEEQTAAELANLKDEQGKPRLATPTETMENQKKLAAKLYMAGHVDQAQAAMDQMKSGINTRIEAESALRKESASAQMRKLGNGDYTGLIDHINKFDYDGQGGKIKDVRPGAPGQVMVTVEGPSGPVTKPMPAAQFQSIAMKQLQMEMADNPALADQVYRQHEAEIKEKIAAAASHGASAEYYGAHAGDMKETTRKKKELDDAMMASSAAQDKPEAERTPAERQAVEKYRLLMLAEKNRGGGGAAGAAKGPEMKVGPVGNTNTTFVNEGGIIYEMVPNPEYKRGGTMPKSLKQRVAVGPGGPVASPGPGPVPVAAGQPPAGAAPSPPVRVYVPGQGLQ